MTRTARSKGSRRRGRKFRWVVVCVQAFAAAFLLVGCDTADPQGDAGLFTVTLRWDQAADLDLHIWPTPTVQCSQDHCATGNGVMTGDVTDGTGPEEYRAPRNVFMNNRYRVGVNLHWFNPPTVPGPRSATVHVATPGNVNQTYGPYELTVAIDNGGYPVTGNTESWWRPVDIVVDGESVTLVAPDQTPLGDPP